VHGGRSAGGRADHLAARDPGQASV
jgi:hypothetical protein